MLFSNKKILNSLKGPILTGVFIGTSFIPLPPWAACFGYVPLFIFWLHQTSAKKVFWGGWVSQFVYTLIGFHWVAYTAVEFGHLPIPLGALALFGFAAIGSLYLPLAGLIEFWVQRRFSTSTPIRLLRIVMLISLGEEIFPSIFPWNHGYPWFYLGFPIVQWSDLVGMQGISTLVLLFNILFFQAYQKLKTHAPRMHIVKPLLTFVTVFGVLNFTGYYRAKPWKQTDQELKALIIQANIGNFEKYLAERIADVRGPIVEKYLSLSTKAFSEITETPDLVIWPETAFPDFFDQPYLQRGFQSEVLEFFKSKNVTLLSGGYSQTPGSRQVYNGLFLFDPEAKNYQSYRKTILLAFGEYFPGAKYFPFLKELVPAISDFESGSGATVFNMNSRSGSIGFGLQICYEGLFPWFSNDLSSQGAQILTNVTNDSWYGTHYQPWQHMYMTLSRALETRRPLIRSTNTGITTAVLADGTILEQSPLHTEWFGLYKIKYLLNPPHTAFEKYGYLLPYLYILLLASTVLFRFDDAKN